MALDDLKHDVIDSLVKKGARTAAIEVTPHLPDAIRLWICSHQEMTRTIGDIARIPIPNAKPWGWLNEFTPDFFSELAEACEKFQGTTPHTKTDTEAQAKAVADQMANVVTTLQPLFELDQPTRNAFFGWMNSTPERKAGFFQIAKGANKDEVKKFAQMSVGERDFLINQLPKEKKPMTYLELRGAVTADPDATRLVNEFLTRLAATRGNVDQTLTFWRSVQRAVENHRLNSLEDFKRLMSFSDPEIQQFLGLGGSGTTMNLSALHARINTDIQATGAEGKLDGWISSLKRKTGL